MYAEAGLIDLIIARGRDVVVVVLSPSPFGHILDVFAIRGSRVVVVWEELLLLLL